MKQYIPSIAEVVPAKDLCYIVNGATPSTIEEENYGGEIVWITPKDLSDQKSKYIYFGERNITQKGYNSCSTTLVPKGTLLMSSRAPIGLLSIAATSLCTNQGFKSFAPIDMALTAYLYYYIKGHIRQIEQLGSGTTFKEVSREDLLKFPVIKFPIEIIKEWNEIIIPLMEQQLNLIKENDSLVKQRDELLPLLMNGQVSVNYDLSQFKVFKINK